MSWADAVVDIAERLEQRAGEWGYSDLLSGPVVQEFLRSTARELRTVVKTAIPTVDTEGVMLPYKGNNRHKEDVLEKRVKEDEFQAKLKDLAQKEEANGEYTTEIADGPLAGDYVPRPASMPIGAKTALAGSVYELKEDRRLHFVR